MSSSVLGQLSLGYQFLWDARRQPAALRLFVNTAATEAAPDARHLLSTLNELWQGQLPLLLSVQAQPLWRDLLAQTPSGAPDEAPWLEVNPDWLTPAELAAPAQTAGLPRVWNGEGGTLPPPATADAYAHCVLTPPAPARPGTVYAGVASQALARDCLAQPAVWALAGWPEQDVLDARRGRPARPARHDVEQLLAAIESDASFETIERLLLDAPVLAYSFLQHLNSPRLGLRHEVETVRQGVMTLGLTSLQGWLREQAAATEDDPDLHPVYAALVVRTHVMDRLLEAGEELTLRNEIYLCGLLAQMPALLDEAPETVLGRLPLSARVRSTLLEGAGPYTPYLRVARALATPDTAATRQLCEDHAMALEDVNRALLRALAGAVPRLRALA